MKKNVLLILFIAINYFANGQISESCQSIQMKTPQEIKSSEPCILEYANYVLNKKLGDSDETASIARKAIISWMEKTPDYTFTLNTSLLKVCKDDNILLFGVYMACMTKAALTTKGDFNKEGIKLFVEYIINPTNNVKQDKNVKKLIDDYNKNNFEKYYK